LVQKAVKSPPFQRRFYGKEKEGIKHEEVKGDFQIVNEASDDSP
jgi:hypothetical protein